MADLTINADDVRSALNEFAASYDPGSAERTEVGRVISAGDGIARVEGLPAAMANELLRFEDGTVGLAMNLEERERLVVLSSATSPASKRARRSAAPERFSPYPWVTATWVVSLTRWVTDRRHGRDRGRGPPCARAPGSAVLAAQVRRRAAADRPQGNRRDDSDRTWTAPADHR